jgi:hypothetical protein
VLANHNPTTLPALTNHSPSALPVLTNHNYFLSNIEAVPDVFGTVGQFLKFRDVGGERFVALLKFALQH